MEVQLPRSAISQWIRRAALAETTRQPSSPLQAPDACIRPTALPAEATPVTFVIEPNEPEMVTVSTHLKEDYFGMKNLLGLYREMGECYSRKCFQKLGSSAGKKETRVFLYFWEYPHGPDSRGWWFGSDVGGSEVWARAGSPIDVDPPRTGWRIPSDGEVKSGALFVDVHRTVVPQSDSSNESAAEEILKTAMDEVQTLEAAAEASLSASREAGEEALRGVYEKLKKQRAASEEVHESLSDHIVKSRRACPKALAVTAALAKLAPRVKAVESSLTCEIYRVMRLLDVSEMRRQMRHRLACVIDAKGWQQQQSAEEEKDTKSFQDALAHSMDVVAAAEDAVEAVSLLAAPLLAELPEQEDQIETPVAKIEDATRQAHRKLSSAMIEVGHQRVIVSGYATSVKENAMSEYSALNQRLQKARKQVEDFQMFRQGFRARVEAKGRLLEMMDSLSAAEVEVEKVISAFRGAANGLTGREEAESAITAMRSAESGVSAVLLSVNSMLQGAVGIAKVSFNEVKERAYEVQSKINTFISKLNGQHEALQARQLAQAAAEEILKVESALKSCQESELPHISVLESFSAERLAEVVHEAEVQNELASKVISESISVLRTKLVEVNVFTSEAVKPAVGAISQLLKKGEDAAVRVVQFKQNAHQSKLAVILKEVVEAVGRAEAAVAALAYASQIFLSGEFEDVSLEVLKQASDSSSAAVNRADMACAQASRIMCSKQRQVKACDGATDLHQLQGRLTSVQQSLAKHRKLLIVAERAIACKQLLLEESRRLDAAEAATQRAEVTSQFKADMGNENLPAEHVDDLSTSLVTAENLLKASAMTGAMDGKVASTSSMEGSILQLTERKQLIQERLCLVSAKTKSQREQRRCENVVGDVIHKIKHMEKLLEQVDRSKQTLIRNAETLPLPQAITAIQEFEASAAEAQISIEHVQSSLAAKSREFRRYACQETVNVATMELDKLAGCVTAAAVKLEAFKTAIQDCKAAIQAQDVARQVAVAESAVIQLAKAADEICKSDVVKAGQREKRSKLRQEAQVQVDTARIALIRWLQDAQRCRLKMDTAQHLQVKLTTIAANLAKARKASLEQEHANLAGTIIIEAKERAAIVDEYVCKAKEACSPLVKHDGEELLAYCSLKRLACALTDHAKAKNLNVFEVLKQSVPDRGKNGISKECFAAFLDTLAEMVGHDEVNSTRERKLAMFVNLDADQDGFISLADLRDTFQVQNICKCNTPNRSKASTGCAAKKRPARERHAASDNLPRDEETSVECVQRMPRASGHFRFVSVCQHGCRAQVEAFSPFNSCVTHAESTLEEANDGLCQTRDALKAKEVELAKLGRTGPAGARQQDLLRLQQKVIASLATLSDLRNQLEQSKERVRKRERSEQMAYVEVRERRQAAALTGDVDSKLGSLETCAQEISKAAHSMTALATRAKLDAFSRPLDFCNNIEQRSEGLLQAAAEIRSLVAKRIASIIGLNPQGGPLLDASVQLEQVETKVGALEVKAANSVAAVQSKCHAIANACSSEAIDALRADLLRRGLTPEGLFQELAEANDYIAEDVFFRHLASLQELASVRRDHIKVLCWYWRVMDGGHGVGRRLFMVLVQRYMVVVRAIAVTDAMDVATSSPLRRANIDEVIEVLEAPNASDSGIVRVRGRLLADSLVGWITVRGIQGTFFLKEADRPQYQCKQDIRLVQSSACNAVETVRILKAGEMFEVVEGPKTVSVKRVHGKACSDGAVGWFSTTNELGGTLAELDNHIHVCISAAVLTDGQNVFESSVLRKVEVGEVIEVLDGPRVAAAGLWRMRCRLLRDRVEGWMTARGSAGSTYASVSTRHYRIAHKLPLQTGFKTTTTDSSSCVRTLAEHELVEVLEPAKDERVPPFTCLKVVAAVDGLVGWIRSNSDNVEKWSPACTCLAKAPMLHAPNHSAVILRQVELDETVELLSGLSETIGDFARVCARKDGIIGWVAIRNKGGWRFKLSA